MLPAPVSLEVDWPVIDYDEAEAAWPPYQARTIHFAADEVTELMVSVHLGRDAVVSIVPGQGAIITPPPGLAPITPPNAGLR